MPMDPRHLALKTATHLGAVALGVACWWGFSAGGPAVSNPSAQASPATAAAQVPSARETILARLKASEEKSQEWKLKADQKVRDAALEVIAKGPERQREKEERLAKLRSLADTYRNTTDLHGVLADALVVGEDDSSIAIFLEWHRRDPEAAFDELARLSVCGETVLEEDAVALAVGTEGMLAQLARADRPYSLWDPLSGLCGRSMGETDQLEALADVYAKLPQERADQIIAQFMDNWVPDEGAAAARFLVQAPEAFRREFLKQLTFGGMSTPEWGWTDEFAAALLGSDLGPCEDLRNELTEEAGRTDNPVFSSCLPPARPLEAIVPIKGAEQISSVVEQLLYRERDYPELFASGEMDLPAIQAALLAQMDGAEAYPEAMAVALFRGLASQRPEDAMEWAGGILPLEKITVISTSVIMEAEEPRLSRRARLLAALPTRTADVPHWREDTAAGLRKSMQEWPGLAPEPAAAALAGIPAESLLNPPPEKGKKP